MVEEVKYPNPRERGMPSPATLKEQWRYAIRQYSLMYSNAWGTAILAGASFFALGWYIKGNNPLHPPPSESQDHKSNEDTNISKKP